ncbi:MAG: IS200/IS605 family transposase [Deltaproteobacteria bacterium]|jgi:putative transposase|nr:IS200/IS605 family transposase [Deltaproteobacteria bacterium]
MRYDMFQPSVRSIVMRCHTGSRSKYMLEAHVVLVRKYRLKLSDGLGGEFKELRLQCSGTKNSGFSVDAMETDQDHIHILADFRPSASIKEAARKLKSYTTLFLWKNHGEALRAKFRRERTFWSDGYFACTAGDASTDTVRRYIETQG